MSVNIKTNIFAQYTQKTPQKHNMTINKPKQTHFSIEGVQSYSAEEVKALKEKALRMTNPNGSFIKLTKYQVTHLTQEKEKEELQTVKPIKITKKRKSQQKLRVNPRNAVSQNNQTIIKLEKQYAKKDALQKKLDKMRKKYKQHFKGIDLKEGLSIPKLKQGFQEKQIEMQEDEGDNCQPPTKEEPPCEPVMKEQNFLNKLNQQKKRVVDIDDSFEEVPLVEKVVVKHMLSYSQRLGDAVHSLFK